MKKVYKTFFDLSAEELDNIIFSGGKIGLQIDASPREVSELISGKFEDIVIK